MFSGPVEDPHQMRIIEHNGITCLDLHVLVLHHRHLNFFHWNYYTLSDLYKNHSGIYTPSCST